MTIQTCLNKHPIQQPAQHILAKQKTKAQHNQTNKGKQNTSQNIKEHPNHALNTNRYLQNKNKEQEAKINAKHIVEGYGKYEGHHI